MPRWLARLRWQLTLSHLAAIAFTLVSMLAAVMIIGTSLWSTFNAPARQPAVAARNLATAVGGFVTTDGPSPELSSVLQAIVTGKLHIGWTSMGPRGPAEGMDLPQGEIASIVVVAPDGTLLGSSDPTGAAFAPAERTDWPTVAGPVLDGERSDTVLERSTTSPGPAALGAAPVLDAQGRPSAAVIVAFASLPPAEHGLAVPLAAFGVAVLVVLGASFVFALAASSLVAYMLSRRLVRRLEQLSRAAEALRAGQLGARVPVGGADEVSQLQQSFNSMAADLERTLHDLAAERDRVTGLLEARRQLVAGVSHELRTPVATVRGYLESMLGRNGRVPRELRTDLETMQHEVGRLQRLIEDLFTLSRATVGRLELRPGPTDVARVVQHQVETQAPLAWQQRRVQVLAPGASAAPPAYADAQRLEQIVSNLLSNAIRHTPPGGLVAVAVSAEPQAIRIDVRDTGEGIEPAALPRIFERFYRGRDSNGTGTGTGSGDEGRDGAGLGLALVKELAEAMGGSVSVESTLGEGSAFSVRVPRADLPPEAAAAPA